MGLALVAGCSSLGDTFNVTPFLREQITGDTWRACLAREYQVQTRMVLREGRDWGEASRFSAKGWAALRGEDVAPGWPPQTPPKDGPLGTAWADLAKEIVLRPGGSPCECAKAQAAFDSWLAASARVGGNVEATRANFDGALALCRNAQPPRVEAR